MMISTLFKNSKLVGCLIILGISLSSCKTREFNASVKQVGKEDAFDFTKSSFLNPVLILTNLDQSFALDDSALRSQDYCFRKGLLKHSSSNETNFNAKIMFPIADYLMSKGIAILKERNIVFSIAKNVSPGRPFPCNARFKDAFEFESITNSNPTSEELSEFASQIFDRLGWFKINNFLPYRAFLVLAQDWSVLVSRAAGNKKFDFRNLEIPGIYLDEMLSKQNFPYLFPTPAELSLWPFIQLRNLPLIPIGLSTQKHLIDGTEMDPFDFHYHDFQHAVRGDLDSLKYMSIKNKELKLRADFINQEMLEIEKLNRLLDSSFKKFEVSRSDLELVLFTFVHEEGQCLQNSALDFILIQSKLKHCNLKKLSESITSLHGIKEGSVATEKTPWTFEGIQKAVELLASEAFLEIKTNRHE